MFTKTELITGLYRKFRSLGIAHIVGQHALTCLKAAHTLHTFRILEGQGKVRIIAQPEEENYFDVYGKPDTEREEKAIIDAIERHGIYYVESQIKCPSCGNWEHTDGIGMCVYSDPCSPFENDYVIDLMQSAINKLKEI